MNVWMQGSSIWLDRPPQLLWKADGSPGTPAAEAAAAAEEGVGTPGLGDALGTWVNSLVVDRGISYEVSKGYQTALRLIVAPLPL
jgi:hypothetical protein